MAKKNKHPSKRKEPSDLLEAQKDLKIPSELSVLPAKDIVPYPAVMMSLFVGREQSHAAVSTALKRNGLIFLVAQRKEIEVPTPEDLFSVGVVSQIVKILELDDGRLKILIQGIVRAKVLSMQEKRGCLASRLKVLNPRRAETTRQTRKIIKELRDDLEIMVQKEHLPDEMLLITEQVEDPGLLSDIILAHYKLDMDVAQNLLEEIDPILRIKATRDIIKKDMNQLLISEDIQDKARDELTKDQREYYLREQIKQIQMELGEVEGSNEDLASLKNSLEKCNLPKLAYAEVTKQLGRLERMTPESSEYALIRTYLEWIADIPWSISTSDRIDLKGARKILDEDHFGLEKVKNRILEYLSVKKLNPDGKSPILCFVGPPGVGKTSLGLSIARALGRKFFRMSLGGMRDEAEIRGHRRTYVGALPGRIIQGMKQASSNNPVFVLDELDKVGADFRGDPASALLEVLDPAQNKEFRDHYLNVDFDLSKVLFIATANTTDTIPEALIDRLEVISIPGYTTEEKLHIAHKFLLPRQLRENGIAKLSVKIEDEALLFLVERYTREAGVRNLEREIGSLCRKLALSYAEQKKISKRVIKADIERLLGPTKFDPETLDTTDNVGLVRGLAWTIHGGEIMPIEASVASGKGELRLTGQLGEVMQESAHAALFYARANAKALGLSPDFHEKYDIHIHVPGGAIPKDGPSAGITIATAVVSALSNIKVPADIAMTGEITLRGNVIAIGGLKEKALGALRQGIRRVIIPTENIKDLQEIPKEQRRKIEFIPVKHISEVFRHIFQVKRPVKGRTRIQINA